MLELVAALVEGIIALFVAIFEGIAGLFGASASAIEGFSLVESILVIFVFLIELVCWLALIAVEVVRALIQWRKPGKVRKPVLWRPSKRTSDSKPVQRSCDIEGDTPYPKKGDPKQLAVNIGLVISVLLLLYLLIAG